jgi:hypothetical protein
MLAACRGICTKKRALLIVVRRAGAEVTREEPLGFLAGRVFSRTRQTAEDKVARAVQGLCRRALFDSPMTCSSFLWTTLWVVGGRGRAKREPAWLSTTLPVEQAARRNGAKKIAARRAGVQKIMYARGFVRFSTRSKMIAPTSIDAR